MPITIGLLLALSFTASLAALGFLIWAIARRQFALSQSDASTIFEPGETGAPDDTTAFGRPHRAADGGRGRVLAGAGLGVRRDRLAQAAPA
jgi:cytochrome c oxidase cbb3-type subunit I